MAPTIFLLLRILPTLACEIQTAEGQDSGSDHQMRVIGLMVGTALMFIGFLNVFLSISGGFEINVVPFLIYFGGLAVWANAAIETPAVRYGCHGGRHRAGAWDFSIMAKCLFWHKQVVFWVDGRRRHVLHVQRTEEAGVRYSPASSAARFAPPRDFHGDHSHAE